MRERERLLTAWRPIADLDVASSVLGWDQETGMPPAGAEARGRVLATLTAVRHERLLDSELRAACAALAQVAEPGSEAAQQALAAQREIDRATRVPSALAAQIAERESAALVAWQEARAQSNFARFAPEFARLLDLKRQEAGLLAGANGNPYDALLDHFEPGATVAALQPIFSQLRKELGPLIAAAAASGRAVDESAAHGDFPESGQRALGEFVASAIGFDFRAGRLDRAAHPFCSGFSPRDVRLTWRCQRNDFRPGLFGILHEAGHGLYEQGLPLQWEATPLGGATGLGAHESQSRLWENAVGRSRGFWRWLLPHWSRFFPDAKPPELESLWPALHTCRPSLIRVEADEATYNLHVIARFELEQRLFAGRLEVRDLPEAWNAQYGVLLGIRRANDAEGVLQDIHWAMGLYGYFPTYTLGNLMAAQLFEAAGQELGDLESQFAAGEFAPLLGWLRNAVHRHGKALDADAILRQATGRSLDPAPYLQELGALHSVNS